jgi:formylglycine-generating enzyme required for sulfatase activity
VHGNVWDWTEDCWNASNAGNPGDGTPRTTRDCNLRVLRGSWGSDPQVVRAAIRARSPLDFRSYFVGFRVARTLSPS